MTPRMWASAVVLFAAAAGSAAAQERPPDDVKEVVVQRDRGEEVRGHLLELGSEAMTVLVDGQRVQLPLATVLRIESGADSIRNGALIGALIAGGWCALVCGQGFDSASMVPIGVVLNAAFGAGIGGLIDASIPGRNTIYRRPPLPPTAQAAVAYRVRF